MAGILRTKKLTEDKDITAKNFEDIIEEVSGKIPTEADYRVNMVEKKQVTQAIPKGMRSGEIRFDASQPTKKLVINIDGKMYSVDLTEIS